MYMNGRMNMCLTCLEALAVHDRCAGFLVLLLGDPHFLEGGKRRHDGATNPHRVFALWWAHCLDLHRIGSQSRDLFLQTAVNAVEHCGTTGHHDVAVPEKSREKRQKQIRSLHQ